MSHRKHTGFELKGSFSAYTATFDNCPRMLESAVPVDRSAAAAGACEQDFDVGRWQRPRPSQKDGYSCCPVRDDNAKQPMRPQSHGQVPTTVVLAATK